MIKKERRLIEIQILTIEFTSYKIRCLSKKESYAVS